MKCSYSRYEIAGLITKLQEFLCYWL